MKLIKKSITLPEDLFKFAEQRAKDLARERGTPENFSAAISDILGRRMRELETGPARPSAKRELARAA